MSDVFSLQEMRERLKRTQRKADKAFLHVLAENMTRKVKEMPLTAEDGKGICIDCGKRRKLGQRGHARGKCKKCRKGG